MHPFFLILVNDSIPSVDERGSLRKVHFTHKKRERKELIVNEKTRHVSEWYKIGCWIFEQVDFRAIDKIAFIYGGRQDGFTVGVWRKWGQEEEELLYLTKKRSYQSMNTKKATFVFQVHLLSLGVSFLIDFVCIALWDFLVFSHLMLSEQISKLCTRSTIIRGCHLHICRSTRTKNICNSISPPSSLYLYTRSKIYKGVIDCVWKHFEKKSLKKYKEL